MSRAATKPVARFRAFPMGMCSFCGGFIIEPDGRVNRRRKWHQAGRDRRDCLGEYLLGDQAFFRARVFARDHGVCVECGPESMPCDTPLNRRGWAADHIVPVVDGGSWTLENAQTLCDPHHKAKTAREAAERAARRRPPPPPIPEQLALLEAA